MANQYIPLVTREESPLWVSLVCTGGKKHYYQKALGWDYEIRNYKYENKTHQIAVPDAVAMQEQISKTASNLEFYRFYLHKCQTGCQELLAKANHLSKLSPNDDISTAKSLFELLESVFEKSLELMPFLASLVLIQGRLEGELKERLAKSLSIDSNDPKISEFLHIALVPKEQANFVQETRNLLRLAIEYQVNFPTVTHLDDVSPAFREKINQHAFDFGWLGTFTFLNEPYSDEAIFRRIQNVASKDPEETLQDTLFREERDKKQAEEAIASLEDPYLRELFDLARDYMFWRFERVDVHFKAEVRVRWIEEKLSDLAGISRDDLMMLTYSELSAWALQNKPLPSKQSLNERYERAINYFVDDGNHHIALGEIEQIEVDSIAREQALHGIRGSVACKGQAQGIVRIIRSVQDIGKINVGDILVTTMTTPDLMLGIEKSQAIVTDEGGVLCHAAIISRELNIPCLIGTEIATKALVDGDVIEIHAAQADGYFKLVKQLEVI